MTRCCSSSCIRINTTSNRLFNVIAVKIIFKWKLHTCKFLNRRIKECIPLKNVITLIDDCNIQWMLGYHLSLIGLLPNWTDKEIFAMVIMCEPGCDDVRRSRWSGDGCTVYPALSRKHETFTQCWPNINPALGECLVFSGWLFCLPQVITS